MEIIAIKWYYGFTTREAQIFKKFATKETIALIVESFIDNSKKSFYED